VGTSRAALKKGMFHQRSFIGGTNQRGKVRGEHSGLIGMKLQSPIVRNSAIAAVRGEYIYPTKRTAR